MTAPDRKPILAVVVVAMAVSLPAGHTRGESAFFTTAPIRAGFPDPSATGEDEAGILPRLRRALGLAPQPSAPMQLVPDAAAPPTPTVEPSGENGPYADIFAPPDVIGDTDAGIVQPDLADPLPAVESVEHVLRGPPPRPLVSVVGALDPKTDPAAEDAAPIGPMPPEAAESVQTAPRTVAIPLRAPRETRAQKLLLAGSTPPVPPLPRQHPGRITRPAGLDAGPGGDAPLDVGAVTTGATSGDLLLASNEADAGGGEPDARHGATDQPAAPRAGEGTAHTAPPDGGRPAADPTGEVPGVQGAAHGASAGSPDDASGHGAIGADAAADGPHRASGEASRHASVDSAPDPGDNEKIDAMQPTGDAHGGDDRNGEAGGDNALAEAELPPPPPSELPKLMRVMSALQDDIARGSGSALAAQRIMSRRVADEIAANSERTLAVPRNARALLHYALTGGSPPDVRAAIDRTDFPPPYDDLLAGALAFLEGRQNDARRHFDAADPDRLSAVATGPVHLALAALTLEADPVKALEHLDRARHSAPGTLIEEASLRRAVLLTAERNMLDRFEALTNRYLRKFRRSAYAGNFRRRLASALTRMRFLDQPDGFERLKAMLEPMSLDGRREIYLDIARSAVEAGRSAVAATAARLSRETAPTDSLDAARADLYAAAADVVDPGRNEAAVAALDTMDVSPLPEGDRALHTAALRLGQAVTTLPALQPELPSAAGRADGTEAGPPDLPPVVAGDPIGRFDPALLQAVATAPALDEDEPSPIETRVRNTLAEIDALLRNSP